MKNLPLLLILTMFSGCAYYRRWFDRGSDPAAALAATEQQMAREQAAQAGAGSRRRVPCTRARTASDNICTLATRTCILVHQDPSVPDGKARCQKARLQCQKAQDRAGRSCHRTYTARRRTR
jgi:hypothetical protein